MYMNKLYNLEEMDKFLETYKLPSLIHEEIENLSRSISNKEIESVIKNLPINKSPRFCREYCIWMLKSIEWPTSSKKALNKVCFK